MTPADVAAPASAPDEIRPVTAALDLELVYERLIVPNFPADERIPLSEVIDGVSLGRTRVLVIGDTNDPIAVAIIDRLVADHVDLLTYFAARADQRGRGIGTRLLSRVIGRVRQEPAAMLLLAEVEHPAHHDAHAVHGDPVARLRFYGRVGARVLDLPYFQPPVDSTSPVVHGLALLALDVPPEHEGDGRLASESGIGAAVATLVARVDPAAHPVAALVAAANDPRGVHILPVERIDEVVLPVGG